MMKAKFSRTCSDVLKSKVFSEGKVFINRQNEKIYEMLWQTLFNFSTCCAPYAFLLRKRLNI